jgi:hypothetical protein
MIHPSIGLDGNEFLASCSNKRNELVLIFEEMEEGDKEDLQGYLSYRLISYSQLPLSGLYYPKDAR